MATILLNNNNNNQNSVKQTNPLIEEADILEPILVIWKKRYDMKEINDVGRPSFRFWPAGNCSHLYHFAWANGNIVLALLVVEAQIRSWDRSFLQRSLSFI